MNKERTEATDREALAAALSWGPFDPADVIAVAAHERLAILPPYPAELVERIARAYLDYNYGKGVIEKPTDADRGLAVAVLDALNGETE